MSHENVELLERAIDALDLANLDALREFYDPDVEIDLSRSRGLYAGIYRGIDTLLRYWGNSPKSFEAIMIEREASIAAGQIVLTPTVAHHPTGDGFEITTRSTAAYTVRGGRITRVCLYQDTQEALEDLGLEA